MKHSILLILITLLITITSSGQKHETYYAGKLVDEFPPILESWKNDLNMKNFKYIQIETGVDSLDVYFGEMTQRGNKGYWTCCAINKEFKGMGTCGYKIDDQNGDYIFKEGILHDSAGDLISIKVYFTPSSDKVNFVWLKNDMGYKTIPQPTFKEKEKKNLQFPTFPTN